MSNGFYSYQELSGLLRDARDEQRREIAAKVLSGGGIFQDVSRNEAVIAARAKIAAEILEENR